MTIPLVGLRLAGVMHEFLDDRLNVVAERPLFPADGEWPNAAYAVKVQGGRHCRVEFVRLKKAEVARIGDQLLDLLEAGARCALRSHRRRAAEHRTAGAA